MELQHEENRIFMEDADGKVVAEVLFPKKGEGCCITRTFVDGSLQGQGIASKLVKAAVETIESRGETVSATCSYAVKWLEKNR